MIKEIQMPLIRIILYLLLPITGICQTGNNIDSFYVANWNIENLFDTSDDPTINDSEFLPESNRQWTDDRLLTKIKNLSKVINYMNNGCGPDILGFQEVENINVLKLLIYQFRDRDYIIVHRDSPDERGIDVALIYDRNTFDIHSVDTVQVELPTRYKTRLILHVGLIHKESNSIIHFFVNHWPSRRGGETKSEANRFAAASALRRKVDSLFSVNENRIIIVGDFNDEPGNRSIKNVLAANKIDCDDMNESNKLSNAAFTKFEQGEGSYRFGSDWNMLDQIIISSRFITDKKLKYDCDSFEIIKPDFIIAKEGEKKGSILPTYSGTKYYGGYSDHFPVGTKFFYTKD